jgi:serine/threonine protein kinase/Flp pilus assembly protein TadD
MMGNERSSNEVGRVIPAANGAASAAGASLDDPRVLQAMEAYLRLLQAGERPDKDAFLARYADVAEALAVCLQGLDFVQAAGGEMSQSAAGPVPLEGLTSGDGIERAVSLGDFRIVREVGKGGMGIVYEAEQLSLRRRVALKVLPFAASMDARQLQRFHNEAKAAACLHHTNIVPVHSVGCERGVHFYAMQFIDGQPLSEIIRQLRQTEKTAPTAAMPEQTAVYQPPPEAATKTSPTTRRVAEVSPLTSEGRSGRDYYRKVAELGIQAAEALDHAHRLGIVHRDIKPGNLMLDGRGNLWVTDFGLAHMQHTEASLTLTGQAVGTPRYMSPEQAMAKRVPIDHRTDVYSLGVTLCELLTLCPAFGSEDRQELLRQIAFEEPVRPRRLERSIPGELETIVLKAMEKQPQDRYATAQELADDLERWLKHEPIHARRPTLVQRASKWVRRHTAAVRAASVLLLVLLVLGIGQSLWWVRQQAVAETEARAAIEEATLWQQEERWSEALSAVRRAKSALRSFGSHAGLWQQVEQRGKDVEMAQRLEEARLQMTTVKDGSFEHDNTMRAYAAAFDSYGLDVEHGDIGATVTTIRSSSIPMQLVSALDHWASLKRIRDHQGWRHLLAVVRGADADDWRNRLRDAWERQDGKAINELLASTDSGKLPYASLELVGSPLHKDVSFERVVALLRQMQQRNPADFWINHTLASLLYHGQPPRLEEAIRHCMIAVVIRPQSPGAHLTLGNALRRNGQQDEAILEFREAIRLNDEYADAHSNLGVALEDKFPLEDKLDEAIAEFRKAIQINKDHLLAHAHHGAALRRKGRLDEADAEHREVIRINQASVDTKYNRGLVLRENGQLEEAIAEYRGAIRSQPSNVRIQQELKATQSFKAAVEKLPAILSGKAKVADKRELLTLAQVCQRPWMKQYVASVRFFRALFADMPQLTDDPMAQELAVQDLRYNAACAAALAGCGQGVDADKLDTDERSRLRQQALDWLRVDLKAYRQAMEKAADKAGPEIAQRMQHWLQDSDFAGVRGDKALAKLPESERKNWHKLWEEVETLRERAAQQPKTPSSARP